MLTFEDAQRMLGKKETKKVDRNTYLRSEDGNMVIRFWETDIVTISPDNLYTLNSGGYFTTTTKERLNSLAPVRIYQERGLWYVTGRRYTEDKAVFADGIQVDAEGHVSSAGDNDLPVTMRKVDRMVSKYIADYAAHVMRLGAPEEDTGGDCLYCQFGSPDTKEFGGFSHYLEHFHEKYFVPLILKKAILEEGYNSPGTIWYMMKADIAQGHESYHLKNSLRKFFRSRKPGIAKALLAGWKPSEELIDEDEATAAATAG